MSWLGVLNLPVKIGKFIKILNYIFHFVQSFQSFLLYVDSISATLNLSKIGTLNSNLSLWSSFVHSPLDVNFYPFD